MIFVPEHTNPLIVMPQTSAPESSVTAGGAVQLHDTVPKHSVLLMRYSLRHIGRVIALAVGGTALGWLAVWWKLSRDSSGVGSFWSWIGTDLWSVWRVNRDAFYVSLDGLMHTLLLVTCALALSGLASVWVGWKSSRHPHTRRWDIMDYVLNFVGGVPVFFLCFLVRDYQFELNAKGLNWLVAVLAVIILAWGEGNASLWTRMFRRQFERVRRAPHILAAQGRGLPIGQRLWRDSAGMAIESIGSRAVILLGGASIIEYMLDFDHGIGGAIIRQFSTSGAAAGPPTWAAEVFVLVSAVALLRGIDAVTRDWSRRRVVGQA